MKTVRLGQGSSMWGDMLEPARKLLEQGNLDYLLMEHLAELTLAVLQRWKAKDPSKGYIPDIIPWMRNLLPLATEKGTKIVCNSGGANPEAAAKEVASIARELGITGLKIGIILGDDLLPRLKELKEQGIKFPNMDTGEEDIDRIQDRIVAANAYIGSDAIIEALDEGAQVVIAGRISDNALTVGPVMHEFGWKFGPPYWDKIGGAIIAGHLVECGSMVSGGASNQWQTIERPWDVAFPIAEVNEEAECFITKLDDVGGLVNVDTLRDQLVYEVHDPRNYIMPDGIADFTSLNLEQVAPSKVKVSNMRGKPRPDKLKLCMGYQDGFIGEGHIWFPWPDAFAKAQWAEKWIREKLKTMDVNYDDLRIDYMGVNTVLGKTAPFPPSYAKEMSECGIRLTVKAQSREDADRVKRLATYLWPHGPIGSSFGIPIPIRQVVSLWPSLVPREVVKSRMVIKEVN